ncbi:MAG TPA: nucleotidyl transferase AbiEii/AbiGii toxin family protein [Gammaproteobacteria bacterium]|jgi:predicted nucleotidyltransferase component of viral defense system|nr:nucleotidyl transferase AbiEii/AbiGii toxin family protein [Gammaproteobacteria bacterium]
MASPEKALCDYINALKEIFQEVALLALWRAKFYEKAAFYGGTALRILYGMDRFSEDLDFTLLKSSQNFDLLNKIEETDFENAQKDVIPFLKDKDSVLLWSKDFFRDVVNRISIA